MIRNLVLAGLGCIAVPAGACGLENATSIDLADGVSLFHRVKSPPLALARHFSLQLWICRDGSALAVESFKIDALMPAHQHGMNYRAKVTPLADGLIETSGLLFHMPGHWQVVLNFEIDGQAQKVRLDYRI